MMNRRTTALIAVLAGSMLAGCAASSSPGYDSRFGDSARNLRAQQVIDPAAPARNGQRVLGTDGQTARESVDRYVDSFKSPPPSNVINIGIGGGSDSGTR